MNVILGITGYECTVYRKGALRYLLNSRYGACIEFEIGVMT
jgi:hypothetical protein